jgi:hypothetical protein
MKVAFSIPDSETPDFQVRHHELRTQRSHENSSSPTPHTLPPTPYFQASRPRT